MQKDGDWIAMLSGELKVTRVDVRANEQLDLVEVLEVDRVTERPARVRFLDRVEGARLRKRLSIALDGLEAAAIGGDHPRYAASSRQSVGTPRNGSSSTSRPTSLPPNCRLAWLRRRGLGERAAAVRTAKPNSREVRRRLRTRSEGLGFSRFSWEFSPDGWAGRCGRARAPRSAPRAGPCGFSGPRCRRALLDHAAVILHDRLVAFGPEDAAEQAHAATTGDQSDGGGGYRFSVHFPQWGRHWPKSTAVDWS